MRTEIVGIGVDLCNVARVRENIEHIGTFIISYFADPEIVYCEQADSSLLRAQRYAARLAAKEAVTKALGLDGRSIDLREIMILKKRSGKPFVFLDGKVRSYADGLGVSGLHLSLAHEKYLATAYCVATRSLDNSDAG